MWALDAAILLPATPSTTRPASRCRPSGWTTLRGSTLFQQGFKTTEYLAAALLDQVWHSHAAGRAADRPRAGGGVRAGRRWREVGLDFDLVPPRYRSAYFRHVFEGGYDAGYYSYIWSEVLDADTAAFITANGGLTRENGERFRRHLLAQRRLRRRHGRLPRLPRPGPRPPPPPGAPRPEGLARGAKRGRFLFRFRPASKAPAAGQELGTVPFPFTLATGLRWRAQSRPIASN